MQGCWIEVRAVRPSQGMNFAVYHYLFKKAQIPQWSVKLALKDGAEIDFPEQAVIKANIQRIRPNNCERFHFANDVSHNVFIAAAQSAVAGGPAAAAASLPSILHDAFRPSFPQNVAAEEEATPK